MVTVVHVRRARFDHYVGMTWAEFQGSVFGKPWSFSRGDGRIAAITRYAEYWYSPQNKWLRDLALKRIGPNDVIACWCAPKLCHGEIVAGYLNWKRMAA